MSNGSNVRWWAVVGGILLATAALAGCAGPQGPGGTNGTTDGGEGSQIDEAQARSAYLQATSVLEEGPGDASRAEIEMTFTSTGDEGQNGSMDALVDEDKQLVVFSMSGAFASGAGPGSQTSSDIDELIVAQVHKTSFFGTSTELLGFYNESQEPPEGFESTDTSPTDSAGSQGSQQDGGIADPSQLFSKLSQEPPEDADVTAREITHEGEPAMEVELSYEDNGTLMDVRLVAYVEPSRPALLEGSLDGEDEKGTFTMTFRYGEDAGHAMEEAVHRLETMTFSSGQPNPFQSGESDRFTNRTIQPSQNPGTIGLEQVRLIVAEDTGSGFGSSDSNTSEPVLTLDVEQGSAENENVSLTFEDADEDGAVSPGDRIVLEDKDPDDDRSYSLTLEDEQTGVRLAPGPGVWLVGLLSLAALGVRRRR